VSDIGEMWPDQPPEPRRARKPFVEQQTRIDTAVNYVLAGMPIRDVARRLGFHEDTVRRWLKTPRAQTQLAQAELEMSQQAVRTFRAAIPTSLRTLIQMTRVFDEREQPIRHSDRIRASRSILSLAVANPAVLDVEVLEDPEADAEDVLESKILAIEDALVNVDIIDAEVIELPPAAPDLEEP
jgi:transposase-like protein